MRKSDRASASRVATGWRGVDVAMAPRVVAPVSPNDARRLLRSTALGSSAVADFDGLLPWWRANGRDLPWRRTRDPWAVLVSELMLQQTQVPRVVTRWQPFLDRFPTVAACAAAPAGDVVRAWAGLGYNRRALNLHRCATTTVERHGGELPDELDALLALPGIGPYTARAILVFAHGRDVGLVDTNAGRFVARALAGRSLSSRAAQDLADGAV